MSLMVGGLELERDGLVVFEGDGVVHGEVAAMSASLRAVRR